METNRIYVDHLGGAHGNYLEYICNRLCDTVDKSYTDFSPFKHNGTSHIFTEEYNKNKLFVLADSQSSVSNKIIREFATSKNMQIIYINIGCSDLLSFMQISSLRAAEAGIDANQLEIDSFSKLQIHGGSELIDNLKEFFFKDTINIDYNAVKDETWPCINNIDEYYALPPHILDECKNVHGITPIDLTASSPNCPRRILREFFTYGFVNTSQHGIIAKQETLLSKGPYLTNAVFKFSYSAFYDVETFKTELIRLFKWLDMDLKISNEFYEIHAKFIKNQPYVNSKTKCNEVIENILNKDTNIILNLTLFEESYVNAMIELQTHKSLHRDLDQYYIDTNEIRECLL